MSPLHPTLLCSEGPSPTSSLWGHWKAEPGLISVLNTAYPPLSPPPPPGPPTSQVEAAEGLANG